MIEILRRYMRGRIVNKIIPLVLFLLMFLSQAYATEEKSLFQLANENVDTINEFLSTAEIPSQLKGMISGRIIVNVDGETISFVVEDGNIKQVIDGRIDDPTTEYWVDREFIEDVSGSEEPLDMILVGLNTGKIKKKDYGITNKLKGLIGSVALKLVNVLHPPEVTLEKSEASGKIKDISISPEKGTYIINPATCDLRRTHIEIRSPEGKDIGSLEVKISEYSGYKSGKAPWGVKEMEVSEDERSLGTFIKVDAPGAEIEWAIIMIKYSKEEIVKRDLIEDSLHIKWYDDDPKSETYQQWIALSKGNPPWVNSVGIDKENQAVWVNISRFSVYGVAGIILQSQDKLVEGEIQIPVMSTAPPSTLAPIEPIKKKEKPVGIIQRIILFLKGLFK